MSIEAIQTVAEGFKAAGHLNEGISAFLSSGMSLVATVFGIAAHVAPHLPLPEQKSGIYYHVHKLVNLLAGNYGKAANKEQVQ